MKVFDGTECELGEGPLWHPERECLFWFDILSGRLFEKGTASDAICRSWDFGECVSAAGWIDRDHLLVAAETALIRFAPDTGARQVLTPLEADTATTRSNDGRADPFGGFWIGTMGKQAERGAGAIYRYFRGEVRRLFAPLTIPNGICFAPEGGRAYFADSAQYKIWQVALDADGWPAAAPELFLDLGPAGLEPDGAVTDAEGAVWVAQWGAGRVAAYAPDGRFLRAVEVPAPLSTCPAFGGPDLSSLFCTSARDGMGAEDLKTHPDSGRTFAAAAVARGLPEPRVVP